MYTKQRYNLSNPKDQQQAQIDAQIEAARREYMRRAAQRVESVQPPTFRGAALELQSIAGQQFEVMLSGPAETGKTYACCYLIDQLLRQYPGSQAVLARKVRDTIIPTVLQTYMKVLERLGGATAYGGKKPFWYDYDNGSRLWFAGLDDPGRALSSERDFIYVNQAEEISVGDWEVLSTRATGRAGNAPVSLVLGDCNPSNKSHWIIGRRSLYVLKSYHKDNPALFDDNGLITAQGEKSLGILANLSEPRRSRLFLGLWASAEGQVYPEYDPAVHLVDRFPIPLDWPRIRVIDFGYTNPFVCSWYAYDKHTNRLYRYREIYYTNRTVEEHAQTIASCEGWTYDLTTGRYTWLRPIKERENIIATICDHDAEDRATLTRYGIPNDPAFKAIRLGIEAVQARLKPDPKWGVPSVYFLRDSLVEADPELRKQYLPLCTEDEIEGYVWASSKDNKPTKDIPIDKLNHGLDALRYCVAFIDDIGAELDQTTRIVSYEEDYLISPI
jgi:PBSX family phage terminase large subunit